MTIKGNSIFPHLGDNDTVVWTANGPLIVSGGNMLSLSMSSHENAAAIKLTDANGIATVIYEGSHPDVAAKYAEACAELQRPRRKQWKAFAYGAALGAIMAATILGAVSASIVAGAWRGASTATASLAQTQQVPVALNPLMPAITQVPELIPALEELQRRAGPQIPSADAALPQAPTSVEASPIVDAPDYLMIPEKQPEEAVTADKEDVGLPAYVPEEADTGRAEATPSPDAAAPEKAPAEGTATETGKVEVEFDAGLPSYAPPAGTEVSVVPASADKPAGVEKQEEGAPTEADAQPSAPITQAEANAEARQAAQQLIEKGFSPNEALDVLAQLEALSQTDASQITPEMLSKLPHEVARMFIESGLTTNDAPDGVPYRIIRVPESVIDAHRGPDGIPSIPEANTWASTGNFVSIPLPGGGDVKSPEDLKEFSLQP